MTPPQVHDERWIRSAIAYHPDEADLIAVIASVRPDLAAKLFAAAAFAVSEVDQFTKFVRDGGAPSCWNLYASTSVACVGDVLTAAGKENTK